MSLTSLNTSDQSSSGRRMIGQTRESRQYPGEEGGKGGEGGMGGKEE